MFLAGSRAPGLSPTNSSSYDGQADFARCHSQGTGSGCCTRSSLLATPMAVRCEFMAFPSSCHALSVYHVQPAANCSVR